MYKKIRTILFKMDPERVHHATIFWGRFAGFTRTSRILRSMFMYKNDMLKNEVMGIGFDNPVGLAAGFDKNAQLTNFMPDIGFGFMEVGSITAKSCLGNQKPRLHRLVHSEGIIVNYGLANKGSELVCKKLKKKKFRIPVGISIAKTNDASIKGKESIEDYFASFNLLKEIGDYVTINISCPNAGDGRSFEKDPKMLEELFKKIEKVRKKEKIVVKISPDIDKKNLDKIISLAEKYEINGFIISNLLKNRKSMKISPEEKHLMVHSGGVSGKHVKKKANDLIKYVYKKTKGKFVIIGCGGIFSGEDAYEKIKNGASLVQLITGMIFEGPGIVKKVNKELVELLEKDGYKNIKEAIGKNIN